MQVCVNESAERFRRITSTRATVQIRSERVFVERRSKPNSFPHKTAGVGRGDVLPLRAAAPRAVCVPLRRARRIPGAPRAGSGAAAVPTPCAPCGVSALPALGLRVRFFFLLSVAAG